MTNLVFRLVTCLWLPGLLFAGSSDCYEQESEHFRLVYRKGHAHLVAHILNSSESALARISQLFDYEPTEQIIISTRDFSDYGSAGARTAPHNFIRIEIEPLELGYENQLFTERLQWLLSHELIHIVVNDLAAWPERSARSIFSKVTPEQEQPLSVPYSLLTNKSRYTPRWHQEGLAAFMETWLNGGYGRALGNLGEMYFRALVLEDKAFLSPRALDARASKTSFLLDNLQYLYGVRFTSYVAATYGWEKLRSFYDPRIANHLGGFKGKYRRVFGEDFNNDWQRFAAAERTFQQRNLTNLKKSPLTPTIRLADAALGWVTTPYLEKSTPGIIFGNHQPHHLTKLQRFDLKRRAASTIGSLPTPSIIQIASTAYDDSLRLFFFTTKNNRLYRDLWLLDLATGQEKRLFRNARVGNLAVSRKTHELWGVRHSGGQATLVSAEHPYRKITPRVTLDVGDVLQHLAVSSSGKLMAATLHQASGRQAIILVDLEDLKRTGRLKYKTITEDGSPEFPSWAPDGRTLYWNAFTNGVSNLYRCQIATRQIDAMSHSLAGLFRPLQVSADSLFAFEFSTEGFTPVLLANRPAERLPAIQYGGQSVIDANPGLATWTISASEEIASRGQNNAHEPAAYQAIKHIRFDSFLPIITGFKNQTALGAFTHLSDPLNIHDLTVELAYSLDKDTPRSPRFHFQAGYRYRGRYSLRVEHNATSFYDLFNDRKERTSGTIWTFENTHYWKFDNPHKIKQTSSLNYYTGINSINDNIIEVNFDQFLLAQTEFNSKNIRRAIGSVDAESGNEISITALGFGLKPERLNVVGGVHAEWSRYSQWAWPHNVLHVKLAAGYHRTEDNLAVGRFYFGGFGNRGLENKNVKKYRNVFRLPGAPIYSLAASRFAKALIEHNLPPLRFSNFAIGQHQLQYIDTSWYTQGLLLNGDRRNKWLDLGGQVNLLFRHWANLESTLSVGFARAWHTNGSTGDWFISLKLLRNL